ncbi:hypothetical protein KAU11_11395 [Candidatus Babeliales bacterium]|nr:hypothetical protein [Candidatus Babeliales bacterium]
MIQYLTLGIVVVILCLVIKTLHKLIWFEISAEIWERAKAKAWRKQFQIFDKPKKNSEK